MAAITNSKFKSNGRVVLVVVAADVTFRVLRDPEPLTVDERLLKTPGLERLSRIFGVSKPSTITYLRNAMFNRCTCRLTPFGMIMRTNAR